MPRELSAIRYYLSLDFYHSSKQSFLKQKMVVPFISKISAMKKILVATLLLACVTAVAFASFNNSNRKKAAIEKKAEKRTECRHSYPLSGI